MSKFTKVFAGVMLLSGVTMMTEHTPAAAQATDPIFVFNRICYAKVPNVRKIEDMAARLAWRLMPDEDLAQFKLVDDPSYLRGWDAQVGERLYRVGVVQSKLSAKMIETFPDFAEGTATSCSMILDDQMPAEKFMPNMQKLAGREPVSRDVPEGGLLTTTWAGGNADLKVFLFAKSPPTGKGGLLNVTVLQK